MISTEEIYEKIGMTESDVLDFMHKYTIGRNEFSGRVAIARFAATLAYEVVNSAEPRKIKNE